MVGGVSGSAILALVFAPSAFALLARFEDRKRRIKEKIRNYKQRRDGLMPGVEQA